MRFKFKPVTIILILLAGIIDYLIIKVSGQGLLAHIVAIIILLVAALTTKEKKPEEK